MTLVTLGELLDAGVHFGHQSSRWNPKMFPYIYTEQNGIHVIDLVQTARLLTHASNYVQKAAKEGKSFLFIGTKRQASEIIAEQDDFLDAYYKRAIVHYYQGEIIEAEADLYRTLALEPRHFDALKVLGLVLEKQNKFSEAKNIYTELHKILPFDESVTEKIQNLEKSI